MIDEKTKKIVMGYIGLLKKEGFIIDRAYVFGSRTRNDARKDSDIDVAVISSRIGDPLLATKYLLKKAHEITDEYFIEPHGFHPKAFVDENPFAWEIKRTGVRVV